MSKTRQERMRRPRGVQPLELLESRALMTIAAATPIADLSLATGATSAPIQLSDHFRDSKPANNYAVFDTSLGTIPVLLTPQTTPKTVSNFLGYVNSGAYNNSIVHRSVPGFIWQGGGYALSANNQVATIPAGPAVMNEFGASNVRGTIAMAKLGSDPNSATDQFFFNEADNSANLDHQNSGFTVFGHVVSPQGLAVMDAVAAVPVPSPAVLGSPLDSAPLLNYTGNSGVTPANLVLIKGVTTAGEVFTSTSDAPAVATAAVQGGALTVTPLSAGTTHITVTGYGSDGTPATETFAVHVSGPTVTPPTTPTPTPTTPTPTTPTPTTPTPTPTPTVTPTGAARASAFTVASRGSVPAAVVAGSKAKIGQTVTLTDPSGAIKQRERITLGLSHDGTTTAYALAGTTADVKLKAGGHATVKLATSRIAAVPVGTYLLVVTATDPDGATTVVNTGRLIMVRAPGAQ